MLNFREINIEDLESGMRVARSVENNFGALLVTPGMILDEGLIKKLKRADLIKITIYDETEEQVKKNRNNFTIQYKDNIGDLKELFTSTKKNDKMDYSQITKIANSTIKMDTNRDIVSMLSVIRDVDEYTYTHSVNVGLLAMMFGRWAGLDKKRIEQLLYAGILHDIGKTKVPEEILNKKGKLTKEEFNIIKEHTVKGYDVLKKSGFLPEKIARGVLMHHERNDGNGYPFAFSKKKIPFIARVLAIVDTYDAMTSDRVYKKHKPPFDAFRLFEEDLHSYDILLAKIFMTNISQYYLGETVKLDNNQEGEIVYINPKNISRPIVMIADEFVDLSESHLNIKELNVKDNLDNEFKNELGL